MRFRIRVGRRTYRLREDSIAEKVYLLGCIAVPVLTAFTGIAVWYLLMVALY